MQRNVLFDLARRILYGEPLTTHDSGWQRQDTDKMYPVPQPPRTASIWPGDVAAAYHMAHPIPQSTRQPRQIAPAQNTGPIAQQPKRQIAHTGRLTAIPSAHVEEVAVQTPEIVPPTPQHPAWIMALLLDSADPSELPMPKAISPVLLKNDSWLVEEVPGADPYAARKSGIDDDDTVEAKAIMLEKHKQKGH